MESHQLNTMFGDKNGSCGLWLAVGLIVGVFAIFWGVYLIDGILPEPLDTLEDDPTDDVFIATYAQDHLEGLVKIGTRIVASIENEDHAVNYLLGRINQIVSQCYTKDSINYYVQEVSGKFYLDYQPYGSINIYKHLQNVVVRVGATPNSKQTNAVLVNAHFDTMPQSPGGSDDGIMCAVMLEVLRNICKHPVQNTIVFLFNGAEESYLQGSHGFITNKNGFEDKVQVVVNLEATGAGGKELLFQAGPEQSWLMKYYKNVPHPHAQVAGEEVFQSGIIPSDSDFRIFRDFGDTIGYDMAYTRNGYRYHTPYDDFANIDLATYQHTGDNVLALVRQLSKAPEINKPKTEKDSPVFYDFFGWFMVYYTKTVEIIINVITMVLSLLVAGKFFYFDIKLKFDIFTLKYLGVLFGAVLLSWILGMGLNALIAWIIDLLDSTMTWYRFQVLVFPLYIIPTFLSQCTMLVVLNKWFIFDQKISQTQQTEAYTHVTRIWWTLLLLIGTAAGIRSVHIIMIPILFTSIANIIVFIIDYFRKTHCFYTWMILYIISLILPTLFNLYLANEVFGLFIPICGRFGIETNPEFVIGAFSWICTIIIMSFLDALIAHSKHVIYALAGLLLIFLIFFIVAVTAVWPYAYSYENPRTQRYWIYHTNRIIRNDNNEIIINDSGFSFYNKDRNSPEIVRNYIGEYLDRRRDLSGDCVLALYCGLAVMHVTPVDELEGYVWIPAVDFAIIKGLPYLNLIKSEVINGTYTFTFQSGGTDHYNIYLSPRPGVSLIKTDMLDFIPTNVVEWNDRKTYFILYVDGKRRDVNEFTIQLNAPYNHAGPTLDIAIAGTYYNAAINQNTEEFKYFMSKFPKWTHVLGWQGTYENWVY